MTGVGPRERGVDVDDLIVRDGVDRQRAARQRRRHRVPDPAARRLDRVSRSPRGSASRPTAAGSRSRSTSRNARSPSRRPSTGRCTTRSPDCRTGGCSSTGLEHGLLRSRRTQTTLGVLFCDLDHFKEINDVFGHAVGDLALQSVARRLEELMRESDTVARTGGDEFVVLLEDLVSPEDAAADRRAHPGRALDPARRRGSRPLGDVQHRCRDRRRRRRPRRRAAPPGRRRDVPRQGERAATGSPSSGNAGTPRTDRRWIERELKRALADDSLELAFQPVIDLRDRRPIGAEALLRWTGRRRGDPDVERHRGRGGDRVHRPGQRLGAPGRVPPVQSRGARRTRTPRTGSSTSTSPRATSPTSGSWSGCSTRSPTAAASRPMCASR